MNKKNYTVFFEIYGKKMKTKVLAESKEQAEQKVKDKIIFHKTIVEDNDDFNFAVNLIDKIIEELDKK